MRKILSFLGLFSLLFIIAGCDDTTIVGVTISSENNIRTIEVGKTIQLSAKVYNTAASQDVIWSSSNEEIADVDNSGLVTGVAEGNVYIIATSSVDTNVSQSFALIVEKAPEVVINPESVTISSTDNLTTCKAGETLELTAVVSPKEASQSVVWSSSDESIAKVTRGVVKGLKEGTVTITVSPRGFDDIKDTIELTIEKNDNPTVTRDWTQIDYATHDEYIDVQDGEPLKVKGVVTQLIDNGDTVDYFIQNGLSGYYVYHQDATLFTVELGKSYEIGGYKKNKPSKQIIDVEYVLELSESISCDVNSLLGVNTSDLNEMLKFQGALVSGEAVVDSISVNASKGYNFTALVNGYSTTFRVDKTYSSQEAVDGINDLLATLVEGMKFEFEGIALAYGSGTQKPQIQLVDAEKITIAAIDPVEYMELVANKIQVAPLLGFSATDIDLPTKLEGFDDVAIAWSSNKAEINVETGEVTHSAEKVVVTLTLTLTYKGETYSKNYEVEVAALDNKVYETVVSLDLEDAKAENPQVSYSSSIKPSYGKGSVTLGNPQAVWVLDNALIDGQSNDRREGDYAIRAKAGGRVEIQQDGDYNVVEFLAAVYGNDVLGIQIKVEYSFDQGSTWVEDDELVTISTKELETFRFTLPEGVKRVAIVIVANTGNRVNIDNVKLMK